MKFPKKEQPLLVSFAPNLFCKILLSFEMPTPNHPWFGILTFDKNDKSFMMIALLALFSSLKQLILLLHLEQLSS